MSEAKKKKYRVFYFPKHMEWAYDVFIRKRTDQEIKDYNDMMDLLEASKGEEIDCE